MMYALDARSTITPWNECCQLDREVGGGMTIARGGGDLQWENTMEWREMPGKIAMEEVEVVEGVAMEVMVVVEEVVMEVTEEAVVEVMVVS